MELLNKIEHEISAFLDKNAPLLIATNGVVDTRKYEPRQLFIAQAEEAIARLTAIRDQLEQSLAAANNSRTQEIITMRKYVNVVAPKITRLGGIPTDPEPSQQTNINITDSLAIPANVVQTFTEVASDGKLYYVEPSEHFAFRLNGQLFHGNIGIIYNDEKNPGKIKCCRFGADCNRRDKCSYYHDPLIFPGSTDKRNYIASSWTYVPPTSEKRYRGRRFGSADRLDTDIVLLQDEDAARFHDQTMHDLLCSLLIRGVR